MRPVRTQPLKVNKGGRKRDMLVEGTYSCELVRKRWVRHQEFVERLANHSKIESES